jgi:hypothetical protein
LTNFAVVEAGITQFGRRMILERLSPRITLYNINRPREVRFGDYPENCMQLSRKMFDVNYNEPKIGDRSLRKLRIRGLGDKVRYWCCVKKV